MVCDSYHVPVMLRESVDGLNIRPGGVYVDVTFGGGGHSRGILDAMEAAGGAPGRLFAFDQDADAEANAIDDGRFTFVRSNFRFLKNWMRYYGVERVDGIMADLGVSSHHFDDAARGFSFRFDAPLDMRMNRAGGRTAADIVATYSERELLNIMRVYGEARQPQRVAKAIVRAREQGVIATTGDLVTALTGAGREPGPSDKKELARVFQALRIEVNGEMRALRQMLEAAQDLLAPGGRLVALTYHSLEDRMVKNIIKTGNTDGEVAQDIYGNVQAPLRALGRAAEAAPDEQESNPRSRSAKLRVAEKRQECNLK